MISDRVLLTLLRYGVRVGRIDLTLAEINLAPVSLAPTPSKIPDIESAMSAATGDVTRTLDGL